ncbi:MAG: hypothetical protein ACYDA4_04790 [Ignavibacteriaceae bacterium]
MKNVLFLAIFMLVILFVGCGKKGEPRVEKLSDGSYKLILNDSQMDAIAQFLSDYPQLKLVTKKEYPPSKEVMEYIKKGDMQYPYIAWGDFNKDGNQDICCLFVTKGMNGGYYPNWWVVIFEGTKDGEFQPKIITNQIIAYLVDGIMYHEKENSVEFFKTGVAAGEFHWDGKKYVVENPQMGGD